MFVRWNKIYHLSTLKLIIAINPEKKRTMWKPYSSRLKLERCLQFFIHCRKIILKTSFGHSINLIAENLTFHDIFDIVASLQFINFISVLLEINQSYLKKDEIKLGWIICHQSDETIRKHHYILCAHCLIEASSWIG